MRQVFVFSILTLASLTLNGQDLHYSQFYLQPLQLNPAQTGLFQGNIRAAALYRSQWESVPVSYRTFVGAFDWKALRLGNALLSAGLNVQQDQAGDAALRWTGLGLNASVAQALGQSQLLALGFGFGTVQRSFDITGLSFQNQWDGDVFNQGLSSKEVLGEQSGIQPSLSAGLAWMWTDTREPRRNVQIGAGAFHLNRPAVNFADDAPWQLPIRVSAALDASVMLNAVTDLRLFGLYQQMGSSREMAPGVGLRYWLDETALQFSTAFRIGDALIPALLVERGSWTIGLSYDVNISNFDIATQKRGGFEIGVVYRSLPVEAPKVIKVCPVF